MKKLTPLFIISLILLLVSCGGVERSKLVGIWEEGDTGEAVVTYNEDGTYTVDYADGTDLETGTWRLDGTTIYTIEDGTEDEYEDEISELTDDKLVVTFLEGAFYTEYHKRKN